MTRIFRFGDQRISTRAVALCGVRAQNDEYQANAISAFRYCGHSKRILRLPIILYIA